MRSSHYFDLANGYWQCQQHFGLSSGATALFFYLLHKFNGARWPESLGVSSLEIGGVLGISKPTLLKLKDELSDCGILEAEFLRGRIRQIYRLRSPSATFGGIDFGDLPTGPGKGPGKGLSKGLSKAPSQKSLPTIIEYKDKDKDSPSSPPERGTDDATAEACYAAYPRKVGKPAALRAIKRALKRNKAENLLSLTQDYAASQAGQDPQYVPHPATWFNQERYLDDPATWRTTAPEPGQPETPQISPRQKLMVLQDLQKRLRDDIPKYRERHRSECAGGAFSWDPGSKEVYANMQAKLKRISEEIDELVCPSE
tara:strand:- start:11785 stop:12723 length:939 start_codon:yes stop_codon:yes gene_type:complete